MAKTAASTKTPVPQGPNRAERRGRRYATLKQAAAYISVTDRTVRQMIADGRITGYANGPRLIRVDLNEIDDVVMRPMNAGGVQQ